MKIMRAINWQVLGEAVMLWAFAIVSIAGLVLALFTPEIVR